MTWLTIALAMWCQAYLGNWATWNDDKLRCETPAYEEFYPYH